MHNHSQSSITKAVAGIVAVLTAAVFIGAAVYFTLIRPPHAFNPKFDKMLVERDVLSGRIDAVPDDLFSPEAMERYRKGDGFTATFRILSDPRADYKTSEKVCGLEPWKTFSETSNPARRQLVSKRQTEFEKCVEDFRQELPIVRSFEIGVDDTDGVNSDLSAFVRRSLRAVANDIAEAVRRDEVRLVFFRLSDLDAFNGRSFSFNQGTAAGEVERSFEEGLGWVLEERTPTRETQIIRGFFNALNRNRSISKRTIYVFSDGIENSAETASFYRSLENGETPDAQLNESEEFPDLSAAVVNWYFPPRRISRYKELRDFWKDVLQRRCKSPRVEIVY